MLTRDSGKVAGEIKTAKEIAAKSDKEHILFIGKQMIMTPGELIFDRALSDGDKVFWCSLRQLSSNSSLSELPSQGEMAALLGKSRPSVMNYVRMLRATRWLVVLNTRYHNNLPTKYDYAISDVQMSFNEVLEIDSGYIEFLFDEASSKNNTRVKTICRNTLLYLQETNSKSLTTEQENQIQNLVSPTNPKPAVKKFDSEEPPVVKKFDSEEQPAVKKFDSEEPPAVKKFDSEDIYNTARTRAPTHLGIPYGDDINITTSTAVEENKNKQKDCPGTGGSNFSFFDNSPVIRELLFDLSAHPHFGKKGVHAICNVLKAKHYETKQGDYYQWIADEETVIEMLCVMLTDTPNSPIPFLKKLILAAYNGEFLLKPKQQSLLVSVHRRIDPNYEKHPSINKKHRYLTPLQQLQDFLIPSDNLKEFKKVKLKAGDKIHVASDINFWKAAKGDVVEITQHKWKTSDYESSLHISFKNNFTPIEYDQICKAIELGLFKLI